MSPARPRVDVQVWILIGALATTAAIGTLMLMAASNMRGQHPAAIIHPGDQGPSRAVVAEDFPDQDLPQGIGHDGQQFYAIARAFPHLDEAAPHLDRPHYRLQRIALPAFVWALHPSGGGHGLVVATVAIGGMAILGTALATGRLADLLGGPRRLAIVVPLVPGIFMSFFISTADNLALAGALMAVALSLSGRHRLAIIAAVVAVLAKESSWLLLAGLVMWRPDRHRLALAGAPAAVAGGWWLALRFLVDDNSEGVTEFTLPFAGLADSARVWLDGGHPLAMASVAAAFALGAIALIRTSRQHPLWWPIALQMAFLPFLNVNVLGLDANGTRMTAPLLVMALISRLGDVDHRTPTPPRAARASAP